MIAEANASDMTPILAACVSIAVNIFLVIDRYLKLMPEIKSLRADMIAKSADTLEKLQSSRSRYSEVVDRFKSYSVELRQAIEGGAAPQEIDRVREECCQHFVDSMNAHINYVEFEQLYHGNEPDSLEDFIVDDLCCDIDRFAFRLRVMNNENLISMIGQDREPLVVTRISTKPWYRLVKALPEAKREIAREKLWASITPLLEVGHDPDTRV